MNKLIWLVLFIAFVTPLRSGAVVDMEDDVIMGNTLPRTGEVCHSEDVHGSPKRDSIVIGNVEAGEVVRIRAQSRPVGDWVMIKPAAWIPLSAMCFYDN